MKKIFIILLLIISLNVYAEDKQEVKLSKCIDGDTASFIIDKEIVKVRFLAIDTPELASEDKPAENYAVQASNFTCQKLTDAKVIELEYENNSLKDKYDRTLAWIWVDNTLLQKELIIKGYAKVKYIYDNYKYTEELISIQKDIQNQKIGIWGDTLPLTYTVTFKDDDYEEIVTVNEYDKVSSIERNKKGYKFIGWFQDNQKYDFNIPITSNITLNAQYENDFTYLEIILILVALLIFYLLNLYQRKGK